MLGDILNSITFARLNIIHSSIIRPGDFMSQLLYISGNLNRDYLPLSVSTQSIAGYFDITELKAFQTDSRIIFALEIPLVEAENYLMFRLYPIPIKDNNTGLYHILFPSGKKFIARNEDSSKYVIVDSIDECKSLQQNVKICKNLIAASIISTSICEAQLFKFQLTLPSTCSNLIVDFKGYNVKNLQDNVWLIISVDKIPFTVKCKDNVISNVIGTNNYILTLRDDCIAYIGDVYIKSQNRNYSRVNIPNKIDRVKLKPLKINDINYDDLNIEKHKLDEYSSQLDNLINEPNVQKYQSWFIYFIVILLVVIILLYIGCKCKRKNSRKPSTEGSNKDGGNLPTPNYSKSRNSSFRLPRFFPSSRRSFRGRSKPEEIELNTNNGLA
ncbi:hypothetical protein ABEB36_009253 [Hypothenemus hampei]|uniref:Envelope fusion protein n=1 Tax=Hypothenemus hampei TaxID=57062 RepID=A0ABD1EG48_HYPHA